MDEESNVVANVSLGAGIGAVVLFFIHFIVGCIPFLGILASLLFPFEIILAIVAIVCGGIGLSTANQLEEGTGKAQSIVGLVLGLGYFLFVGGLVCLGLFLGVGVVVLDSMLIFV